MQKCTDENTNLYKFIPPKKEEKYGKLQGHLTHLSSSIEGQAYCVEFKILFDFYYTVDDLNFYCVLLSGPDAEEDFGEEEFLTIWLQT